MSIETLSSDKGTLEDFFTPKQQEIIQDILAKLELSTMSGKEKAMWTVLLPNIEEKYLKKLQKSLDKEIGSLTNLYMQTIKKEINA